MGCLERADGEDAAVPPKVTPNPPLPPERGWWGHPGARHTPGPALLSPPKPKCNQGGKATLRAHCSAAMCVSLRHYYFHHGKHRLPGKPPPCPPPCRGGAAEDLGGSCGHPRGGGSPRHGPRLPEPPAETPCAPTACWGGGGGVGGCPPPAQGPVLPPRLGARREGGGGATCLQPPRAGETSPKLAQGGGCTCKGDGGRGGRESTHC